MYTVAMFGNRTRERPGRSLSSYAPSFRLKRLAWSSYGFGHTARREPGDLRGTVIGKKGRFRGLHAHIEEVVFRNDPER
jgi:hypothetical protein